MKPHPQAAMIDVQNAVDIESVRSGQTAPRAIRCEHPSQDANGKRSSAGRMTRGWFSSAAPVRTPGGDSRARESRYGKRGAIGMGSSWTESTSRFPLLSFDG